MAMDAMAFAVELQTELAGKVDHNLTILDLNNVIKSYLETNCDVTYSWDGINPSDSSVDGVTEFVANPVFSSFNLTIPVTDNAVFALNQFAISITSQVFGGVMQPVDPTFVLISPIFANNLMSFSPFGGTVEDVRQPGYQLDALKHFTQNI